VFQAEKDLMRYFGHEVAEYTVNNADLNNLNPIMAALDTIWSIKSQKDIKSIIKNFRPQLVHFHNTFLLMSPASYYSVKNAGIPVVQTLHNYRLLCSNARLYRNNEVCELCIGKTPPWPGIKYKCWRDSKLQTSVVVAMLTFHRWLKTWRNQVDVYIALTEFARHKFIEGGIPAEKIVVKPNFLNKDPGYSETRDNYALFVGRLSSEKGLLTLIETWKEFPNEKLKIVGDGTLLGRLEQMVNDEKLSKVEMLGYVENDRVLDLMKNAAFLVFPSQWYEGFPMTIIEAFACGLPVIASRLGAMEEIIDDKFTGLLYKTGDPEHLANKIDWAFSNPEKLIEIGKNARRDFEEKFTPEKNYQALLDIYQRALDGK